MTKITINENYFTNNEEKIEEILHHVSSNDTITTDTYSIEKELSDNYSQTDIIEPLEEENKVLSLNEQETQTELDINTKSIETQTENIIKKHSERSIQTDLIQYSNRFTQTSVINELKEKDLKNDVISRLHDENNKLSNENLKLNAELIKMNVENSKLEYSYREISKLLSIITKTHIDNTSNLDIDKIRNELTIIANRELRMKYAFPFINLLSKYPR
jgi:hypothetical protein